MTIFQDSLVGLAVGSFDVALLWPLVVIATRREAGSKSLLEAIKQGKLWSGGTGALTMLVPYCVLVETLSNQVSKKEEDWKTKLGKVPFTSFIIAFGLQPIEKKIVMDSLFQTIRSGKGPIVDLYQFSNKYGISRLFSGFFPLWGRETIYVSSVTVLNPILTGKESKLHEKCFVAFSIGFFSGFISAPLQTLNVMKKDETNIGKSIYHLVFENFSLKRLYFGSGSRSLRTGAAGVLWLLARENVNN